MKDLHNMIREKIKEDFKTLDFKCTECGVGINKGEETFVVSADNILAWCKSCSKERDVR